MVFSWVSLVAKTIPFQKIDGEGLYASKTALVMAEAIRITAQPFSQLIKVVFYFENEYIAIQSCSTI